MLTHKYNMFSLQKEISLCLFSRNFLSTFLSQAPSSLSPNLFFDMLGHAAVGANNLRIAWTCEVKLILTGGTFHVAR